MRVEQNTLGAAALAFAGRLLTDVARTALAAEAAGARGGGRAQLACRKSFAHPGFSRGTVMEQVFLVLIRRVASTVPDDHIACAVLSGWNEPRTRRNRMDGPPPRPPCVVADTQ